MREWGLSKAEVAEIITGFENRYRQGGRYDGIVYQRGAWGVICDAEDARVITIVRRCVERWEH